MTQDQYLKITVCRQELMNWHNADMVISADDPELTVSVNANKTWQLCQFPPHMLEELRAYVRKKRNEAQAAFDAL